MNLIRCFEVDPPRFIEWVMIFLAIIMAIFWLLNLNQWPYLVLCASFVLGNATSIWVRTVISPPIPGRLTQATAVLCLSLIFFGVSLIFLSSSF
jgi:hypothetical protein